MYQSSKIPKIIKLTGKKKKKKTKKNCHNNNWKTHITDKKNQKLQVNTRTRNKCGYKKVDCHSGPNNIKKKYENSMSKWPHRRCVNTNNKTNLQPNLNSIIWPNNTQPNTKSDLTSLKRTLKNHHYTKKFITN